MKVKFDSKLQRYVAEAKDERGKKIERKGKSEALALSNLLIAVNHRSSSIHLGRWNQTFVSQMQDIAEAYSKAPIYEAKASMAYMDLAADSERRVAVVRQHLEIQIVGDPEPYKSPEQLGKDVKKSRRIKISRANTQHPIWTEKQVIDYRICHDVFGYVAASVSAWDWAGENEAFAFHVALLSEESQKALFTESIALAAYNMFYRTYGAQKVALFPQFMDEAQEKQNPYKGHPGVHPSQTIPLAALPGVKPLAFSSVQDEDPDREEGSYAFGAYDIRTAATGTGEINPMLGDPNRGADGTGWQSQYAQQPMITPNGQTLQEAYGDPIEAAKTSENANLINTSNAPATGGTEWAHLNQEDPGELATMKKAVVNAFRVVLLSPRKDLRWNAIHYQDISHVPGDEDDPKVYWDTLEQKRQEWNTARGHPRYGHVPYMKHIPNLVNALYQKAPSKGYPEATRRAQRLIQDWATEEQDKLMREDEDKPEEKRRPSFQIETKGNYNLEDRLKTYLKERQPKLDKAMTRDVKKRWKTEPINTDEYYHAAAVQAPAPAADVSKYGAFMGDHLKAIAQISQHVDTILQAALEDVHEHDGTGHHFRAAVLQLSVPGVGPKVCSFAWLLLQPMTSQLATIDTHMMDLLGHQEKEMNNRDYFGMERELQAGRDAAGYQHMPMGQFQWGMWDYKRTGAGSHQDHSAMAVLDPKPHDAIDWAAKEQPIGAAGAVEWKNMWQTQPPEWWAQTLPARQQAWDDYQDTTAANVGKAKVPYVGLPQDYNPDGTPVTSKSKVAMRWDDQGNLVPVYQNKPGETSYKPWIVHPQTNERLTGLPGQTIMDHAMTTLSVQDPREVWAQLPDEAVGKEQAPSGW